jgi:hypothetical protein
MRLVTKRAGKALIFTALIISLTACAEKSSVLSEDISSVETPGTIKDITVTKLTESEPGSTENKTEATPYEELPDEVKAKITTKPTPTSTSKPPEAERNDTKFSGELPEDFTPPTSGKFTKQGSVLDGDRSFLGYTFTQEWQIVAADIKESLKNDGWECIICQDLVSLDGKDDEVKYIMEMKNGTRKVNIAISVYNGKTNAGFNFRA